MMDLLREKYTPDTLPYHVVVPSLPGYTLSGGPLWNKDFGLEGIKRTMNQLMIDLGFASTGYVAQGGDVGSFVARLLGSSTECRAVHGTLAHLYVWIHWAHFSRLVSISFLLTRREWTWLLSELDLLLPQECRRADRRAEARRAGSSPESREVARYRYCLCADARQSPWNHRLGLVVQPPRHAGMVSKHHCE